jgi:diguanylate cyclase (GGDEF)-like protein
VIAILNVQTHSRRITPDVMAAIRPVVDTVGLLIVRYEETRELVVKNQQIHILYAMASAGAEQLDDQALRERVEQILGRIAHACGYEHAFAFIYDPHREALVLQAGREQGSDRAGLALNIQEGRGITVRAFSSRKPVLVRDTQRSRGVVAAPWPVRSELAMPLVVGDRCVGVLDVESRKRDAFTRLDIQVLRPFASGLALLIDNQQKTHLLRDQAMRDALTGFFNRRMMDQVVPREIERACRYHRDLSLVMLDIDAFKAINDHEGHEAGDHVLRVFSRCIRQVVRAPDVVFRYGGDEFLILLPETSSVEARKILARLNATSCPELTTSLGSVTFSAGIASYALDARAGDLVKVADDRLYQSKRLGKGHITVR